MVVNNTEPDYIVTAIGVAYISTAVIVIPLHIICSYLMWHDKTMRNPTYQFMINLSIADSLELISIALYAGIIITWRMDQNANVNAFMGFLTLASWYVNCILLIFIAFSRYISMAHTHLTNQIFTRKRLFAMHTIPWIIFFPAYFGFIYMPALPTFPFTPEVFTWVFGAATSTLGLFLHWWNFAFNGLCAICEMTFNTLSLIWVHKTRKNIQTVSSADNRRREIKLLMQSFVVGSVFTMASVFYTILIGGNINEPLADLAMQCVWTFNHCNNPIVYLIVNTKLRRAFLKLISFGEWGKPNTIQVATITT